MTRITRKFWHINGERWIVYFAGDVAVVMTHEALDVREAA